MAESRRAQNAFAGRWARSWTRAVSEGGGQDYKTQLQHLCNVKKLQAPHYVLR